MSSFPGKLLLLLACVLVGACSPRSGEAVMQPRFYPIDDELLLPTSQGTALTVEETIEPYREQLTSLMEEPVAELATALRKGQPESTMGNWTADVLRDAARDLFPDHPVAFAVQNYGGLRISEVPAGPLRVGTIYEMMPFDNELVLVPASGKLVTEFVNHMLNDGGWPVSSELSAERNGGETRIAINGEPIDPAVTYYLALPDYVANGGSDAGMLAGLPQEASGKMIRDLLIEYARQSQGPIRVVAEGKRVKLDGI